MTLHSDFELSVSREKLQRLEATYERSEQDQSGSEHVRNLTLRSLGQLIKKLKEEIIRYEIARADANNEPYVSSGLTAPRRR